MTKYFPKDDIIALAGQIVPEGYELRELTFSWDPEEPKGKGTYIVFGHEGKFYQVGCWNGGERPKGFLVNWEGDVPGYEVYLNEETFQWEAVNEN